jgi:hypothetical protein
MTETPSPRQVVEQLLAGIAAGPSASLAALYAAPGGLWLRGREEIRQRFARAGRMPLWHEPERVVVHETADPELVIAEYEVRLPR